MKVNKTFSRGYTCTWCGSIADKLLEPYHPLSEDTKRLCEKCEQAYMNLFSLASRRVKSKLIGCPITHIAIAVCPSGFTYNNDECSEDEWEELLQRDVKVYKEGTSWLEILDDCKLEPYNIDLIDDELHGFKDWAILQKAEHDVSQLNGAEPH